jgi:hypothetical protein
LRPPVRPKLNHQARWHGIILLSGVLLFSACQNQQAMAVASVNHSPKAVPPTAVPTTLPSPVPRLVTVLTQSLADDAANTMPSFTLPDPTQLTAIAQSLITPSPEQVQITPSALPADATANTAQAPPVPSSGPTSITPMAALAVASYGRITA